MSARPCDYQTRVYTAGATERSQLLLVEETSTWTMQWYEAADDKSIVSGCLLLCLSLMSTRRWGKGQSFFFVCYIWSTTPQMEWPDRLPRVVTRGRTDGLSQAKKRTPLHAIHGSECGCGGVQQSWGRSINKVHSSVCVLWIRSCSSSNATCCQRNTSLTLYLADNLS